MNQGPTVRRSLVCQRSGRLQQQALVAVEGGKMREHFHGGVGRAEHRDRRVLKEFARGGDARLAHPARYEGLGRATRRVRNRAGRLFGVGHGLGRKDGQHAIYALVGEASRDRGAVARAVGVSDEIDRVSVGPVDRKRLPQENWVGDLMLECDVKIEKAQGKPK